MKLNWKSTAASLAVLIGISGVAFGADRDARPDRDHRAPVAKHDDHDRDHDSRDRGRVIVPDNRRVYNNGWYGDRDHDGDRDRPIYNGGVYNNGRVYNNGAYSPYYGNAGAHGTGYYGGTSRVSGNAVQIGYQDGVNDGRNDRVTGHSFRPTQDDNYKDATRGYSSAFGDKQSYKNTYRQGYEQGYQQGYGR